MECHWSLSLQQFEIASFRQLENHQPFFSWFLWKFLELAHKQRRMHFILHLPLLIMPIQSVSKPYWCLNDFFCTGFWRSFFSSDNFDALNYFGMILTIRFKRFAIRCWARGKQKKFQFAFEMLLSKLNMGTATFETNTAIIINENSQNNSFGSNTSVFYPSFSISNSHTNCLNNR